MPLRASRESIGFHLRTHCATALRIGDTGKSRSSDRCQTMPTTTRDATTRIRKPTSRSRDNRANRLVGSSSAVAGVRISHPDRLIYPDLGISKIQLAQYYERIAEWIVPHVAARPLTLVHCPAGITAPCHYLKHAKAWGPNALRRVRIQEKTKVG